jgi:hypothetical protein
MEYIVCVCVIFMNIMRAHYCAETLNIFPSQPMHLVEPAPKVYMHLLAYDTRPYVASDVLMSFLAGIHGD